jgi:hypothetical protein
VTEDQREPDSPDPDVGHSLPSPEPDEELEVVFTTNDDSEALVVKGLLEASGFQVAMSTPEAPIGVFPISSSDLGQVRLTVRAEQAEEARRAIEESEEQGPQAAEEAERESET